MFCREDETRSMHIEESTIVVTGVCGVLGAAVASEALDRGLRVIGIDIRESSEGVSHYCSKFFGGVDLSDYCSVKRIFEVLSSEEEHIKAIVNVAGGFSFNLFEDSELDDWDHLYRVNLKTAVIACRAALPSLEASGSGCIVNVGASAALRAGAGMAAYAASKAGVAKLTESLSEELRGRVRVNAILPAIIDTPANRESMPDADFNEWTRPEDIAAVIMLLLSRDARAITGALVPV